MAKPLKSDAMLQTERELEAIYQGIKEVLEKKDSVEGFRTETQAGKNKKEEIVNGLEEALRDLRNKRGLLQSRLEEEKLEHMMEGYDPKTAIRYWEEASKTASKKK